MSSISAQLLQRAVELHASADVVDLHNDFLLKARFFRKDFLRRGRPQAFYMPWRTDLDLHRVAEGGVSALGFALWAGRKAWAEGRSNKHPEDIHAMLYFILSGLTDEPIDLTEIEIEAARIGVETLQLWRDTLARTEREIQESNEK